MTLDYKKILLVVIVLLILAILAKSVFSLPFAMGGSGKLFIKGPMGEMKAITQVDNTSEETMIQTPHGKFYVKMQGDVPEVKFEHGAKVYIRTGKVVIDKEKGTIIIQTPHKNITITPQEMQNYHSRVKAALVYQLKLQAMNQTLDFNLEQENGKVYLVHKERVKAKILGLIPVSTEVEVKVDPETGAIEVKRPWWYFLVSIATPEGSTTVETSGNLTASSLI